MKYIIELGEEANMVQAINVTQNGNVYVGAKYVTELKELNADYINEHFGDLQDDAYNKGYAKCQDDYSDALKHAKDTAYKKGLEEGREQMPCDTCACRHNNLLCADCKWNYGSRYKVDSIGVGDVVKTYNGITFVVTKATTDGIVVGFEGEGNTCRFALSEVTKTGEHYNINEILGGLCDD